MFTHHFQSLLGCFKYVFIGGLRWYQVTFQSLLGCFKKHMRFNVVMSSLSFNPFWDASGAWHSTARWWTYVLSIPFGMLPFLFNPRDPYSFLPFNPFWDASCITLKEERKKEMTSFNPFWDASFISLFLFYYILTSFNPFWDASSLCTSLVILSN